MEVPGDNLTILSECTVTDDEDTSRNANHEKSSDKVTKQCLFYWNGFWSLNRDQMLHDLYPFLANLFVG